MCGTLCSEELEDWRTRTHGSSVCATYGICGHRRDGDVLNCANNTAAQPLSSNAAARKLQDVCPQLVAEANGTYCCTEEQIDVLAKQASMGCHTLLASSSCFHDPLLLDRCVPAAERQFKLLDPQGWHGHR